MLAQPSILITDDDRTFRDTLYRVFEPKGYQIHLASDGAEALEILRNAPVHVIIADMHMPRLTGLEMIRLVRKIDAQLPCILMSAQADDWLFEQARLEQVFSVLSKPVSRRTITGLVCDALRTVYNWP